MFPCKHLQKINNNFWFDDVRVSPNSSSKPVADYLHNKNDLWMNASIRVVSGLGITGRAPLYGVNFQKAVNEALKKGFIKSQFYLPAKVNDIYYSNLLLHVNRRKESNGSIIQLQAWQYCIDLEEVFYIHAESKDFNFTVHHLDGAKIYMHKSDVAQLFTIGNKIKGDHYEKQFRLDGNIPIKDFYEIIKRYLPIEELVNEAFEVETSPSM